MRYLEQLDELIETAEANFAALKEEITAILGPEAPSDPTTSGVLAASAQSDVASRLGYACTRLRALLDTMKAVRQRVEV